MWEKIKNGALYIATPVVGIAAFVIYQFLRIKDLQEKLAQTEASKKDAVLEERTNKLTEEAHSAAVDYYTLREQYLRAGEGKGVSATDPGSRQGSGDPEEGSDDPGSTTH